MGSRHCFALDLVADAALIHEYCRSHEPGSVWPEVIDHIRAQGIENMEIWRCGNRLFMIVEATDDYPRTDPSQTAVQANEQWEASMARFQQKLPQAGAEEKWAPMRCIFQLRQHDGRDS
jgi:L-rhamnose mutarotase